MAVNKILIIAPSWLGDAIMSHSLIQTLSILYPEHDIDVAAPASTREIYRLMPQVKTVISLPFEHKELQLINRWRFARQLALRSYARSYVLPNSLKSALIPFFAGIALRIGWLGEQRVLLLNSWKKLEKKSSLPMVDRYYQLAFFSQPHAQPDKAPYPVFPQDRNASLLVRNLFGLTEKPILLVAPGAMFGKSKMWPKEYYAQVCLHFLKKDWQVLLLGTASELEDCKAIAGIIATSGTFQNLHNLAGKTSLEQVCGLLQLAKRFVSNDSGLMHLAAAYKLAMVSIFGSSNPEHTPPLNAKAKIAYKKLACSPCFKRDCPLGHHNCMKEITPESVIGLLETS